MESAKISATVTVHVPISKVWALWTEVKHIEQWNQTSDEWHTPKAMNDLRVGGTFVYTMAQKNGGDSFDFQGVYDVIIPYVKIEYTADGRKSVVTFAQDSEGVIVTETFEADAVHSHDVQRGYSQGILNSFKKYAEGE